MGKFGCGHVLYRMDGISTGGDGGKVKAICMSEL